MVFPASEEELKLFKVFSDLFGSVSGVHNLRLRSDGVHDSGRVSFSYGTPPVSFNAHYSSSCLEVYGKEQVPLELTDALTQALSGAQHQQYNPRTHYWSGKAIDDYFLIDKE